VPVRFLLAVLALLATAMPAAPAVAAPNKPFEMNVAPASEWAGVTDDAYTVTLTNRTATQQLGSADITIPAALTVVAGPSSGTVTSGNVLQLRSLGLPPGGSVTVTLGLRMPCVSGAYTWAVAAKQSNDFSGPPGNALGPVSGTRTTTVNGSCRLRFADKPAGAEKNGQIRADAFQPASSHLVTVEALDGSPAPQRLTWFTGRIDLRLVQPGPGSLTPNPASSTAVDGLASFSNLSIDLSGNYNLRATTTASGFTAGDSPGFQIIDDVGDCQSSSCRAQVNGRQSTSTLTGSSVAGSGFALLSLNLGTRPECGGYTPPSSEYYEFQLSGVVGDKTVLATYSKSAMKSFSGGQSALEICFAAPQSFPPKSGSATPFDYDGDPGNGAEGFVGLLPNCPPAPASPCVLDRANMGGDGAQVLFFVPAAWGDPRYN
jgi:hypothetical protein